MRKSNRNRQKNKRDIGKWVQTENPEIPDKG